MSNVNDNSSRTTGNGCATNIDTPLENRNTMARIQQEASMAKIKCKLEEFQSNLVKDMESKIACMMNDVIKDIQTDDAHVREFKGLVADRNTEMWKNRPQAAASSKEKGKKLGDKIFAARDSLFTCLYRVPHIRAIYHAFWIMLVVMIMNTAIHDYLAKGVINFGQHTINAGMRGFWRGVGMWSVMQATVFLVYYGLKMWADVRIFTRKNESLRQLWDASCLCLFVFFQLFFMYAVSYGVVQIDLAFVSGASVLLEMTRMIMKMHAFVRTNVPRILEGKLKVHAEDSKDEQSSRYPSVSQFTYYMFAPTFIYRDNYIRSNKIDWMFAMARFMEVIGVMFFMANIHERYIYPFFHDFGLAKITTGELVAKLFGMIMPGTLIFLSGFYCILHAWLNFTGEILRFSDRMYYKDWWTAGNYDTYYRNWNVVVHDWLYEFIYKDMFYYVFGGSKTLASLAVFYASAVIHEYILVISLRFVLPVMFVFFGVFGVLVVFLTRNINKTVGNLFLWLSLSMGNGLMISLYAMEKYARINCNVTNDSWSSYFIPAILSCNGLE